MILNYNIDLSQYQLTLCNPLKYSDNFVASPITCLSVLPNRDNFGSISSVIYSTASLLVNMDFISYSYCIVYKATPNDKIRIDEKCRRFAIIAGSKIVFKYLRSTFPVSIECKC